MSEINLLAQRKTPQNAKLKALSILRIIAVVLLFSVSFSSIGLFILTLTSALPGMQKRESDLLKQITVYDTRIQKSALITDRVKQISGIFSKRTQYENYLDLLLSDLPANVLVDSLSIVEKKDGDIRLTVSSSSLSSLNLFLDTFTKRLKEQKIANKVFLENTVFDAGRNGYFVAILIQQ